MIEHPENSKEYKGLTVNAGVENLPSVNPYATFRRKKTVLTPEEYFEGIRRGDVTVLSLNTTATVAKYPLNIFLKFIRHIIGRLRILVIRQRGIMTTIAHILLGSISSSRHEIGLYHSRFLKMARTLC